ncbi:MAG: DUF1232 domain-containing protein [Youngiibacter sp.]|nr:DUF1232 domain-containing protein [Youngiibacter sp.]
MKVTSVTTTMRAEDLLHDLRVMVEPKVPGLVFDTVELEDSSILVKGSYKYGISIPFLGKIKILDVSDNVVTLKIAQVKVLKIGIPKFILSIASKTAAGKAKEMGIKYADGALKANISSILSTVPHVGLTVDHIIMQDGLLSLSIADISADIDAMQAESNKDKEAEERAAREKEEKRIAEFNRRLSVMDRTRDSYTDFRDTLHKKTPEGARKYFKYAMALPDIYVLAYRLLKDKRVSKRDKAIISVTLGYPLLPFDLLPDRIPLVGAVDDIALITFGVNHIMKRIPIPIIVQHWQGDLKTLKLIRDNVPTIMSFTPGKTLDKAYGIIDSKLEQTRKSYLADEAYLTPEGDVKPIDLEPIFRKVIDEEPGMPVSLAEIKDV